MSMNLLEMSVSLVTAHLSQNPLAAKEVPEFLKMIHQTLQELQASEGQDPAAALQKPASAAFPYSAGQSVAQAPSAPARETETAANAAPLTNNKISYPRDNDLADPAFDGLDAWLAARISHRIAGKLDPRNEIHPTVFDDSIICLEDGAKVTLLRSYIKKRFNLTPTEYIEKWQLPDDYPMSPPAYRANKRSLALKGGLGQSIRANRERAPNNEDVAAKADAPVVEKAPAKSRAKSSSALKNNALKNSKVDSPATDGAVPAKRKRGRPPKIATPIAPVAAVKPSAAEPAAVEVAPVKGAAVQAAPVEEITAQQVTKAATPVTPAPAKRGRPRKLVAATTKAAAKRESSRASARRTLSLFKPKKQTPPQKV